MLDKTGIDFGVDGLKIQPSAAGTRSQIIPPKRVRYLSEIAEQNRAYDAWVHAQAQIASKLYQINGTLAALGDHPDLASAESTSNTASCLDHLKQHYEGLLELDCSKKISQWPALKQKYASDFLNIRFGIKPSANPWLPKL